MVYVRIKIYLFIKSRPGTRFDRKNFVLYEIFTISAGVGATIFEPNSLLTPLLIKHTALAVFFLIEFTYYIDRVCFTQKYVPCHLAE